MFVAKVSSRNGRTRTIEQRGRESFNDFMNRVERLVKNRDVTIQVREIVVSSVGE